MSELWPFDPAFLTVDNLLLVGVLLLVGLTVALVSVRAQKRRVKDLLAHELDAVEKRTQLDRENADLRSTLASEQAALAAERVRSERLGKIEDRLVHVTDERDGYSREIERLEAEKRTEAQAHEARLEELRGMKKELEDRFGALASGVLESNSQKFLGLVSERFEKHRADADQSLAKRQEAIQNLVKPLDEKLGKFDNRIGEIEKQRLAAQTQITEQVQALREGHQMLGQETRKLAQALRRPKSRGRWGEVQLRQVFEMAGMAEHVDFELEKHMVTDDGPRRPDAVVHIPGGRSIVVDAKAPMDAYLDALEAESEDAKDGYLLQHARQMKDQVKALSSKKYQDNLTEAPDFVVMFIPGESFVAAAAEADPGLIEYAFENKILIASPTTLMALVKAIAYGWQQEKMAQNVVEVQKLAKEVYDRLVTFGGHLDKVGSNLGKSVSAYNSAVASLEGRVLPSTRKFEALGVVPEGSSMPEAKGIDTEVRNLSAIEFISGKESEPTQ